MPSLASAGSVQFILPAKPLRRYLSTYYFLDTGTNGAEQEDLIYPEWATVPCAGRQQATPSV